MSEEPVSDTRRADASHAARGGFVQLLGIIAQGLMPLYYAAVKRLFGPVVFGYYSSAFAVTDVLTRLGICGADRGMFRFVAAHRANGEDDLEVRALGTGLRLWFTVTSVAVVAMVALAGPAGRWLGRPALPLTLPYMSPAVAGASLMLILVAATLGRKVTRVSFFVRGLIEPGMLFIAAGIAYLLEGGIRGLAAAHGAAYVAIAACAAIGAAQVFGARKLLAAPRSAPHPSFTRFALPLAVSDGVTTLFQRTDLLILPFYVGPEPLGAYFVGELLGRVSANVRYAFDGIAAPILSEALALGDRDRLRYNLRLVTRWVTTLSLPIATTMIALRGFVLSLYGPGSSMAGTVVVLATLGHLVSGTMGMSGHVVVMSGRTRLILINQVGATILNFILNLVLVPRFGINGAALSVFISLSAMMFSFVGQVWAFEGVHPFHAALLKPVAAAVATLAAQLAVVRAVPGGAGAALAVGAGVVTYLAVLVMLGLSAEERDAVRGALARVRRLLGRRG